MTSIALVHLGDTILSVCDEQVTGDERPMLTVGDKVFKIGTWVIGVAGTSQGRREIEKRLTIILGEEGAITLDHISDTLRDVYDWTQAGEPASEVLAAELGCASHLYLVNFRGAAAMTRDPYIVHGSGAAYMQGAIDTDVIRAEPREVWQWDKVLVNAIGVAAKRDIYTGDTYRLGIWS